MSTYDWIDPFAKIEQLQQEISRAEQRGERRMGEAVSRYFDSDFRRYGDQRAREIARDLMDRAVAPFRHKLTEAMSCYALADRIAIQLGHFSMSQTTMTASVDADGDVRFDGEVSYGRSAMNDYRRKADELLQTVALKAGWLP